MQVAKWYRERDRYNLSVHTTYISVELDRIGLMMRLWSFIFTWDDFLFLFFFCRSGFFSFSSVWVDLDMSCVCVCVCVVSVPFCVCVCVCVRVCFFPPDCMATYTVLMQTCKLPTQAAGDLTTPHSPCPSFLLLFLLLFSPSSSILRSLMTSLRDTNKQCRSIKSFHISYFFPPSHT